MSDFIMHQGLSSCRRGAAIFAALAMVLSMVIALPLSASAAERDQLPDGDALRGVVSSEQLPEDVRVGADVDLSDPIVPSTASADVQTAACGPYAGWAPPYSWAEYQWIDCSYWGTTPDAQKFYDWEVPYFSEGSACSSGKGFHDGEPYWESLGCGKGGSRVLDWGQIAAIPRYKTTSVTVPLGTPTYWY